MAKAIYHHHYHSNGLAYGTLFVVVIFSIGSYMLGASVERGKHREEIRNLKNQVKAMSLESNNNAE